MKFIGVLFLLVLIAAGTLAWLFLVPFGPASETFVDIAPGTSAARIATQLAGAGVIRSPYAFDLLRATKGGNLKAGEYRFDRPAPLAEVYARLLKGDVYTRTVTVPEGLNIFDIAQAVENAGLGSRADFLAAERQDTPLIADFSPQAASLEGYLFPDTYHFSRHATPAQMLTVMVRRFRAQASALGLRPEAAAKTVILASLIEKEVSDASERPLVASVFVNHRAPSIAPLSRDGWGSMNTTDSSNGRQVSGMWAVQEIRTTGSSLPSETDHSPPRTSFRCLARPSSRLRSSCRA